MKSFLLLMGVLVSYLVNSQTAIKWERLDQVEFVEYFDRNTNQWLLEASFGEDILILDQTEIILTGYVIPLDVTGQVYALSAFAFSSCFFCGGAGPETVMGLNFAASPPELRTDDVIRVKGTLIIKKRPSGDFHYTLDKAEIIERY